MQATVVACAAVVTVGGLGDGTGGVEPNRCTLESPPIWPSSNDGKNENPKSEEFLDSEVHNLGERVRF